MKPFTEAGNGPVSEKDRLIPATKTMAYHTNEEEKPTQGVIKEITSVPVVTEKEQDCFVPVTQTMSYNSSSEEKRGENNFTGRNIGAGKQNIGTSKENLGLCALNTAFFGSVAACGYCAGSTIVPQIAFCYGSSLYFVLCVDEVDKCVKHDPGSCFCNGK